MATSWKEYRKTITVLDEQTLNAIETLATLVAMRNKAGISQKTLASRIGMSQPQLAKIEALDSIPTLQTLDRYARALGCRISLRIIEDEQIMNYG